MALAMGAMVFMSFSPDYYTIALDCEPYSPAILAEDTYNTEVKQYSRGIRTLVVDNKNYNGAFVSTSGLPYAYRYVAQPNYLNAIVLRYENEDDYIKMTKDYFTKQVIANRISRVVLLVEDQEVADIMVQILGVYVSVTEPTVLDVQVVDKLPVYVPYEINN
jgi:hypothetical protein